MSQKQMFIKTTDKETADRLISIGFHLISKSDSIYTFLNEPPVNFVFDEADKNKIAYTNTLII